MSVVPELSLVRHHLGWPPGVDLGEEIDRRVDLVTRWYREHGKPWTRSARVAVEMIRGEVIRLAGGQELRSALLADRFRHAEVEEVAVLCASAGPRIDPEVRRHWSEDRPDEAMFLGAVGSAVAEQLRAVGKERIAAAAHADGLVALPAYSPGFKGWELADQRQLFAVLEGADAPLPGPLRVLESGGLEPSKSTLTAVGLTRRSDLDIDPQSFWTARSSGMSRSSTAGAFVYSFAHGALRRWSRRRLEWLPGTGDRRFARFRFDGSTCSNTGLGIAMTYDVELERRSDGAVVMVACGCSPRPGDRGYEGMCAYRANPGGFALGSREPPFEIGATLTDLLGRRDPQRSSGCLCTRADREHKWRIVLETIHFDLFGPEGRPSGEGAVS